jgi:hypothetical protein
VRVLVGCCWGFEWECDRFLEGGGGTAGLSVVISMGPGAIVFVCFCLILTLGLVLQALLLSLVGEILSLRYVSGADLTGCPDRVILFLGNVLAGL